MIGCIPRWLPFRAINNLFHFILKSCSQRGKNKNLSENLSNLRSNQIVSPDQFVSINHDVGMSSSQFFSVFWKIRWLDWQIKPQIRKFCQSWVNHQKDRKLLAFIGSNDKRSSSAAAEMCRCVLFYPNLLLFLKKCPSSECPFNLPSSALLTFFRGKTAPIFKYFQESIKFIK